MAEIPFIDPRVHWVGVSKLRQMDAGTLRAIPADELYVLREGEQPLGVLMPYDLFIAMSAPIRERGVPDD